MSHRLLFSHSINIYYHLLCVWHSTRQGDGKDRIPALVGLWRGSEGSYIGPRIRSEESEALIG